MYIIFLRSLQLFTMTNVQTNDLPNNPKTGTFSAECRTADTFCT